MRVIPCLGIVLLKTVCLLIRLVYPSPFTLLLSFPLFPGLWLIEEKDEKWRGKEMLTTIFPLRYPCSPAALKERRVRGPAWMRTLRRVKIPRPLYQILPYLYSLMRAHHSCPYGHLLNVTCPLPKKVSMKRS